MELWVTDAASHGSKSTSTNIQCPVSNVDRADRREVEGLEVGGGHEEGQGEGSKPGVEARECEGGQGEW